MMVVSDYATVVPVAFSSPKARPLVTSWAIYVTGNFALILSVCYRTAVDFDTGIKRLTQSGIIQNTGLATSAYQLKGMGLSTHMSRERGILVLWSLQFEVGVVRSEFQWDVWLDKKINGSHRPPTLQVSESNPLKIVWDKKSTHVWYRRWNFMERYSLKH
jgi:hypothetical protein